MKKLLFLAVLLASLLACNFPLAGIESQAPASTQEDAQKSKTAITPQPAAVQSEQTGNPTMLPESVESGKTASRLRVAYIKDGNIWLWTEGGSSASAGAGSSASAGAGSSASLSGEDDEQQAHVEPVPSQPIFTQQPKDNRFIRGFLTASLVFCVGPMAILGSIQDGLSGDFRLLAIKSVLDGFAALAFASSLGAGVLFSTLIILAYQGGLSLLALQAQALISPEMMNEMTAVGGVLLLGIAISSLLEIKPIRVGNFLPALVIAPIIVAILGLFK